MDDGTFAMVWKRPEKSQKPSYFLAGVVENLLAGRRFWVPVMLWERMTITFFASETSWSEVLLYQK